MLKNTLSGRRNVLNFGPAEEAGGESFYTLNLLRAWRAAEQSAHRIIVSAPFAKVILADERNGYPFKATERNTTDAAGSYGTQD
ncbi:MAG: hypothetical protein J6K46_05320 [Sutterella sp.]|nr:hypothetical protein [Sutterella sp.]